MAIFEDRKIRAPSMSERWHSVLDSRVSEVGIIFVSCRIQEWVILFFFDRILQKHSVIFKRYFLLYIIVAMSASLDPYPHEP